MFPLPSSIEIKAIVDAGSGRFVVHARRLTLQDLLHLIFELHSSLRFLLAKSEAILA